MEGEVEDAARHARVAQVALLAAFLQQRDGKAELGRTHGRDEACDAAADNDNVARFFCAHASVPIAKFDRLRGKH